MPFGEREDELWEAMKPQFKPRLISDPNARYAKSIVEDTGQFAPRRSGAAIGSTVRATLARVVGPVGPKLRFWPG